MIFRLFSLQKKISIQIQDEDIVEWMKRHNAQKYQTDNEYIRVERERERKREREKIKENEYSELVRAREILVADDTVRAGYL